MVLISSTGTNTATTRWWLQADDLTRKAVLLLRIFERTVRSRISGYAIVPPEKLLHDPKLVAARTIVTWLEGKGYRISINHLHWQGYVKFAFRQMPSLFFGQLKNDLLFRRYCSQASYRKPPPESKSVPRLIRIYQHVLRPELRSLAATEMLGISASKLRMAFEE